MNVPPNNRITNSGAKSATVSKSARAQANEAFDKEVDEELQRQQFAEFWEKYSTYILAAAAAIVLTVGGYKFMESRRIAAQEAAGARYIAAARQLSEGKGDDAAKGLQALTSGGGGIAAMAQLRLAGSDASAGRTTEAIAKYDAVSRLSGLDPVLADFARLQSAILQLDTASWADLQARLTPLASDKSAWRHSALETLGMAALKAGNRGEARTQFEKLIGDKDVPQAMAERARIVMGSIAASELADKAPVEPAPKVQPAPAPAQKK